ncbi:MAG: Lrp/AsnC ligand binding domain-containing protein [Candidatus Bathyarchaeota archaeon]|nr:Lrp/AsnC ligand binding domain-containing protein [Candidatus Bathyarchaeota archaeon]
MQKSMQKYLVLVKLNPTKTESFFNKFSSMASTPIEGVNIYGSYNVFGNWDIAIWFEADSNDNAIHFVGEKIRSIEGVLDTHTMPATTIKEYM